MRTIAFYLPQFHAIPENDRWWGEGFTEWVNVRRARPSFRGHDHPRRPGVLGEYDLTQDETHRKQSDLARLAGIDGFCLYFYWFGGRRLLERPVEAWRADPGLLPYCLSWANESWTRRWDGKDRDVLVAQGYERGFTEKLFIDLLPHFRAPHYLRQTGNPILVVHRADLIPEAASFARTMRKLAQDAGIPGLHLVAAETTPGLRPSEVGFDAVVEFPPVGANTLGSAELRPLKGLEPAFRGRLMSYEKLGARYSARPEPVFTRYRGVAPGWDNTARRQETATVYVGSSPGIYAAWLVAARAAESERGDAGLVFINAWNEWAEGAYLEPDTHFGSAYLLATKNPDGFEDADSEPLELNALWSLPQIRSITMAAAGSVLAWKRRGSHWVHSRGK